MSVKIVQGSDRILTIQLVVKREGELVGEPIDITGADKLDVCFKKTDGTNLIKSLGVGSVVIINGPGGKFTVELTETETALLLVGLELDIEVELEKPTDTTQIIQMLKVIDVVERLC